MTNYINQGVGFLNYYGHGDLANFAWVYDARHLNSLTNTHELPVVFSAGCQNGEFAPLPPWQDYYDTSNNFHQANGSPPVPAPNSIQPGQGTPHNCDRESCPENWLVYRETGAIAFVASMGLGNPDIPDKLDTKFFEGYSIGYRTFGEMWVYMIQQYLDSYGYFDSQGNVVKTPHPILGEWERNTIGNGLTRFNPFGDPSLVVGGAFLTQWSGITTGHTGRSGSRYRIVADVTVPVGNTLFADSSASILFESGRKITALDPTNEGCKGFYVHAYHLSEPVHLISIPSAPIADHIARGIRVLHGDIWVRNGGQIKLY